MIAPGKACDDCGLCCKTMGVPELDKPADTWCTHFAFGRGCNIYDSRPSGCRGFYCRWIQDPSLGPEWKPNKCKLVLFQDRRDQMLVHVDPGAPGAWQREPYFSRLVQMARNGLAQDALLLILERGKISVLLPDRVVELGAIGKEDQIMLEKKPGPSGIVYDVSVKRPA
jgi:hypothetical protein